MKISSLAIAAAAVLLAGIGFAHAGTFDALSIMGDVPVHLDAVAAMAMMLPLNNRARGLVGVRADAADPMAVFAELRTTVEAMRDAQAEELKGINAKFADVVTTEKVERINAEITTLQNTLDDINRMIAAAQIGGGGGEPQDPARREYSKQFNKWFRKGDRAVDADLNDLAVKAAMQTDSDPDGGYVVTESMEGSIDRVLGTVSAMRSLARVMTISGSSHKKLVNIGGATSGWVGEREARPETNTPQLKSLDFPAMELYANPAATQTMLDDASVSIEQWIADEVGIEFAEQEGAAYVSGDGSNKPRGILAYDTVANSSYSWGNVGFVTTGAAATFASSNPADAIISLYYALKAGYRNGATWLLSDAVMGTVRKFKSGDGNYLWAPPSGPDMPATILGKPAVTDDNMSALGANAFPVAFANFQRAYLIVDRTGVRVLRDPFTNKPYVHFYTTKRVGGGIQNFEAIKLLKCATP